MLAWRDEEGQLHVKTEQVPLHGHHRLSAGSQKAVLLSLVSSFDSSEIQVYPAVMFVPNRDRQQVSREGNSGLFGNSPHGSRSVPGTLKSTRGPARGC